MNTILATTSSFASEFPETLETIRNQGFEPILNPYGRKLNEQELASLLDKHKPVGLLAGTEFIIKEVLEKAQDFLRVISRVGVGWDNVDRVAAEKLGILVFRTPGVLNQAVAELTIGLILTALRHIVSSDHQIRRNQWQKKMGSLLKGKTVGIIGFGGIGQQVGKLVCAFDATVIYYDPSPTNSSFGNAVTKKELLKRSDIITLHADSKETIIGANEINKLMKPRVILINTARGCLVDEAVLYHALSEGRIACACLDVFENEPYQGLLCELENVIVTPHIGSYAREARQRMEQAAVENLFYGLREVCVL